MVVVTPNFQNPTGATLPMAARLEMLRLARSTGSLLVENDIYGDLRYEGEALADLEAAGRERRRPILLRSFSKLAFPGLAGGLGDRAAAADRAADRSQAVERSAYRPAFAGRAAAIRANRAGWSSTAQRMLEAGRERLQAALSALARRYLPAGAHFTRPAGRNESVGAAARTAGCRRIAGARPNGKASPICPGKFFGVSRSRSRAVCASVLRGWRRSASKPASRCLGQSFHGRVGAGAGVFEAGIRSGHGVKRTGCERLRRNPNHKELTCI